MSKKTNSSEVETKEAVAAQPANRVMKFFRFATLDNPTRRGYKIEGHPGCLVIERSLFADGDGPEELTLSVDLVEPKAKTSSADKEAAKLAKAQERATKLETRLKEQQEKAEAAKVKAQAALDAAKAKVTGTTTEVAATE